MTEVSIILATCNRAAQLGPCLDALAGIDTKLPWELVVVDNGPSADTAAVIDRYRDRFDRLVVLEEPRRGLGRAQLTGIRRSTGRILTFTDDDCYVAADYIDALVAAFDEDPAVGFVGGRILLHDPTDVPITIELSETRRLFEPYQVIFAGTMQGANLSFRRDVLEAIGGPDPRLGPGTPYNCVDIDLVTEAVWSGFAGAYDPRPTVSHHHGRKDADLPALRVNYARGRGAHLARRVMAPNTRREYATIWLADVARVVRARNREYLIEHANELRSAIHYVAHGGRARHVEELSIASTTMS